MYNPLLPEDALTIRNLVVTTFFSVTDSLSQFSYLFLFFFFSCTHYYILQHSAGFQPRTEHYQSHQFSSVQSLSRVRLFGTPLTSARQASLSITNSQNLLKLMSIKSMMPSSHLILCRPLLLLPPIPPSIRVFSNESTLCMRWPES